MLEYRDVSKTYGGPAGPVQALRPTTLTVSEGELVAVVGPSGCGKTTLLLIGGTLLRPTEGDVIIDGRCPYDLDGSSRALLRAKSLGFVFQQFHLIPYLNVLDNVLVPSLVRADPGAEDRARELIERFRLVHRMAHTPTDLSTGECQRVALARALLNRPSLLLADEPTGNLDETSGREVLQHLADIAHDGTAVLLVTHDSRASDFCDRCVTLV